MASIGDLVVRIVGDNSSLKAAIAGAQAMMTGLEGTSRRFGDYATTADEAGRRVQQLSSRIGTVGIVATTALGALGVKAAIDFESAFAGVRKTVNATAEEFDELSDGIREMSKTIPVSAVELAGIGEAAGQLGIQSDKLLGFTRVMADLGVTTNLSSHDAAIALARLDNVTGGTQGTFDRLGSTLVGLGNTLAANEREILDMASTFAAFGHSVGLTQAQILGFAGAFKAVGAETESGGTAFQRIIGDMRRATSEGGAALETFARVSGVSAAEFKRQFETDAAGAILKFIEGLSHVEEAGTTVDAVFRDLGMSNVRLIREFSKAAAGSNQFASALKIADQAWDANNALTIEAQKRYDTAASKLKILKGNVVDLGVELGNSLYPALSSVTEALTGLSKKLDGVDSSSLAAALATGLFLAVVVKTLAWLPQFAAGIAGMELAFGGLAIGAGPVLVALAALGFGVYKVTQSYFKFNETMRVTNKLLDEKNPWITDEEKAELKAAADAVGGLDKALSGMMNWLNNGGVGGMSILGVVFNGGDVGNLERATASLRDLQAAREAALSMQIPLEGYGNEGIDALGRFTNGEYALIDGVYQATRALGEQTDMTRKKGQTTDKFVESIKNAGFGELDLSNYVDDATTAIRVQTDGTILLRKELNGQVHILKLAADGQTLLSDTIDDGTGAWDANTAAVGRNKKELTGLAKIRQMLFDMDRAAGESALRKALGADDTPVFDVGTGRSFTTGGLTAANIAQPSPQFATASVSAPVSATNASASYNIVVNGAGDPSAVAKKVMDLIDRRDERYGQYGTLSGRRA